MKKNYLDINLNCSFYQTICYNRDCNKRNNCFTHFTPVVYENNFLQQFPRSSVNDAVQSPQQDGRPFVVKRNDDTGRWQLLGVWDFATSKMNNQIIKVLKVESGRTNFLGRGMSQTLYSKVPLL